MSDVFYNFTESNEGVYGPAVAVILGLEMVAGLFANAVVLCITLMQRKSLSQPSTIFFTSLTAAHLLMVLLYLPVSVIAIGAEEWIFGSNFEEKKITCSISAFVFWYSVLLMTINLAVISFDRFLFIVKPHFYKQFMRPTVALILTIAVWILSAALNSTPLYGLGAYQYGPSYGSCIPTWRNVPGYLSFMAAIFLIVLAFIIVTSLWTFCFTRKFMHEQEPSQQSNVYQSKERRLFGIFGAMLIVYGVCFLPSVITGIMTIFVILPGQVYAMDMILFQLITSGSPLVQSYFRPDIKERLTFIYKRSLQMMKNIFYSRKKNNLSQDEQLS